VIHRGWLSALVRRSGLVVLGLTLTLTLTLTLANSRTLTLSRCTQPAFAAEEYAAAERLVVAYPPFRAACAARGIRPEHVRVDPWCAGWYSADDDPARRLGVPMLFVQEIQRRYSGDVREM